MSQNAHVFIVQGDLPRLTTDAWLLPCDGRFHVIQSWIPHVWADEFRRRNSQVFQAPLDVFEAWRAEERRTVRFDGWPGRSQAWLTNTGGNTSYPIEWYLAGVDAFVAEASEDARRTTRRAKPLLGVPAVGTGFGGQFSRRAAIITALYDRLLVLAERHDVDIAFVLYDAASYAAAQVARRRRLTPEAWPLEAELQGVAAQLGKRAKRGELVMFLGAGVSAGAGLPTWKSFLESLAQGALSAEELELLAGLDPMDAGSLIERKLGSRQELETRTRAVLDVQESALQHALVASIPHEAAVTLNYDRLYETACRPVVGSLAILPHDRGRPASRWLLKLHGCIDRGELVLAREDYLRFGERRAALAGIVQALLITKHMLFIGFGLTDANFLRILDDVRRALGDDDAARNRKEPCGTVLMLQSHPLREVLYDDDLKIVSMGSADLDTSAAARRLEILLDAVGHHASSASAFFFDLNFDALLSDGERAFRDELLNLRAQFARNLDAPVAQEFDAWIAERTNPSHRT